MAPAAVMAGLKPPPFRGRSASPDFVGASRVGVQPLARTAEAAGADGHPHPPAIAKQLLATFPFQGEVCPWADDA
jgi:hypothetical protein